jgi:hypothetical protein
MKRFFSVFMFSFAILTSHAQQKVHSLFAGPIVSITKINDKGPSALTYSNLLFGTDIQYTETTEKCYDALRFQFHTGKLGSNIPSSPQIQFSHFQFNWNRFWHLHLFLNSSALLGFQWYTSYSQTLRDTYATNSKYYCFESSIAPIIKFLKSYKINDSYHLNCSAQGSVAMLGYFIRPSISSLKPIAVNSDYPQNFMELVMAGRMVTPLKMQHIITSYKIELAGNKRFISGIEYAWSYLVYKIDNHYYEINHQFIVYVGYHFK